MSTSEVDPKEEPASVPANPAACSACGAERYDREEFCRRCGHRLVLPAASDTDQTQQWHDDDTLVATEPDTLTAVIGTVASDDARVALAGPLSRPGSSSIEARRSHSRSAPIVAALIVALGVAGTLWWIFVRDPGTVEPPVSSVEIPDATSATTTTSETTETVETAAFGDLSISEPIRELPCDGRYIAVYRSAAVDDSPTFASDFDSWLSFASLEAGLDPSYSLTRTSCSALAPDFEGRDLYIAYLGPFEDLVEACDNREMFSSFGISDAYVRHLDESVQPGDDEACPA